MSVIEEYFFVIFKKFTMDIFSNIYYLNILKTTTKNQSNMLGKY